MFTQFGLIEHTFNLTVKNIQAAPRLFRRLSAENIRGSSDPDARRRDATDDPSISSPHALLLIRTQRMVQSDPTDAHGNLFPIFVLSLIQFFLVPITLWRVGAWLVELAYGDTEKEKASANATHFPGDVSSEWGKAAAARAAKNKPTAGRKLRALFSGFNLYLLGNKPPVSSLHLFKPSRGGGALRPVQGVEHPGRGGRIAYQESVQNRSGCNPVTVDIGVGVVIHQKRACQHF